MSNPSQTACAEMLALNFFLQMAAFISVTRLKRLAILQKLQVA